MGRQTVTPEQWLAGIEVADENPTIRELAGKTLHQLWYRKSQAEHLDRRLQQLAPLCPCDKNDLPLRECPVHGDGKTFVAEVRELRAMRERARNVHELIAYPRSEQGEAELAEFAADVARIILGETR